MRGITLEFGKLKEVDVRELWKHEQYNFSEWLAKEENIEMLGDEVGVTFAEIRKEVFVGAYRCDLVAQDETSGAKIIIENQLEATNHDHLGKIITYASGLEATVVIWIVKEAREEHRSAIEWLNSKTTEDVSFFLIEIHAYKIGDSLPAPKFEVVEKPNDFVKTTKGNLRSGELTFVESERLNFWTQFNEVIKERDKTINICKATTNHWYNVSLGSSKAKLSITLNTKEKAVGIEVYIQNDKTLFDQLYALREQIEDETGLTFDWQRLDGKKASRIRYLMDGLDFENQENYPELMNEVLDQVIKMRKVFKKYIK